MISDKIKVDDVMDSEQYQEMRQKHSGMNDDDLRFLISGAVNNGDNYIGLKSALKVMDGRYRNSLYTLRAVSDNLEFDSKKTKLSIIGWANAILGHKYHSVDFTPESLAHAPKVARIVRGLELLESAEKEGKM